MSVTESVRHRLRLSRELLTGAASCAPMSDHPQRVACDLIISHDAATLALAAICQQLGRTPNKTRDSLLDYLVWLRSSNHPDKTPPGMDYCVDLHQARIELQDRYLLPSPDRWTRVKAVTLEYIEDWSRRYLGMELDAGAERAAQPGPEAPTANENDSQRRRCPRYECAGELKCGSPSWARRKGPQSSTSAWADVTPRWTSRSTSDGEWRLCCASTGSRSAPPARLSTVSGVAPGKVYPRATKTPASAFSSPE